jgi:hypothetical protein
MLAAVCLLAWFAAPPSGAVRVPRAADVDRLDTDGPTVGPEHRVSDPVDGPPASNTSSPDTAFDGTNHLVVWEESRTYGATGVDIYGARVNPQGTVLDIGSIPITTAASGQFAPKVAFGGGTFLVVWSTEGGEVYGARISPAGTVLDPGGIPISRSRTPEANPDVAYGGGTFLVAWDDGPADGGTRHILGTRVSPTGTVLDPAGIPLSTDADHQSRPAISFGGDSFLVVWLTYPGADLLGVRVSPTGSVLDPSAIAVSTGPALAEGPSVAFNGTDHLVVWREFYESSGSSIRGARVTPSGAVRDPAGIAVATRSEASRRDPAVTALGSTFLVGWNEAPPFGGFGAVGARVDADGNSLDPVAIVITDATGSGEDLVLGADGVHYFAAWVESRVGPAHLFGASISSGGSVLGPGTLIPRAAPEQTESAVAYDGANYLVVWTERSGWSSEVRAARLDRTGRRLDVSPILLGDGSGPTVAFDGDGFVVAWLSGSSQIAYARVSSSGYAYNFLQLLDPPSYQWLLDVDLAVGDAGALVVWSDTSRSGSNVSAVRVSRDDVVLDPDPIAIGSPAGGSSVASDGHDYLVTWRGSNPPNAVLATRVTAEGTLLDPAGIVVEADPRTDDTAVAWNGQRYLAIWSRSEEDSSWRRDLFGARIGIDGTVQDAVPVAIATAPDSEQEPVVAAANGQFLVAWRETDGYGAEGDRHDVRGARVADDGAVLDRPSFPIAASATVEWGVALTAGPGATWGASSTRFVPESPYGASRVFLRSVSPK